MNVLAAVMEVKVHDANVTNYCQALGCTTKPTHTGLVAKFRVFVCQRHADEGPLTQTVHSTCPRCYGRGTGCRACSEQGWTITIEEAD